MGSVTETRAPVNGGSGNKMVCTRCAGTGRWIDRTNGTETCPLCDGFGHIRWSPPDEREAPTGTYQAVQGTDLIDTGTDLVKFIDQLKRDWPAVEGHVAVWYIRTEGAAPTVVALLCPNQRGGTIVRWL